MSVKFKYSEYFNKDSQNGVSHNYEKLNVLWVEIEKLTHEHRLKWGQREMFHKLIEEVGEYSAAKLGDKKYYKETPRQEAVDIIITAISLFMLEGGTLNMLCDYGMVKLEKAKNKKENLE